jgi:hypothetical protein
MSARTDGTRTAIARDLLAAMLEGRATDQAGLEITC